jgi:hypothetical protein
MRQDVWSREGGMPKRFPPYKLTVSGSIGKIVLDRPEKLDAAI